MTISDITDLTGHFLLAMPRLAGSEFNDALVLICEHNDEGAIGVVVNQPGQMQMAELFMQLGYQNRFQQEDAPVFMGGPIGKERGFILHSDDVDKSQPCWEQAMEVCPGIQLTTTEHALPPIARNEGPQNVLFALGYSGWAPGQLEDEISNNCWLTCKADPTIIFHVPHEERLSDAANILGVDLSRLCDQVGHG